MALKSGKKKALYISMSVIFGIYAATLIFPFLFIILNSFKTNGEFIESIYAFPVKLFQQRSPFKNFAGAFADGGLVAMFANTAILTAAGTAVGTFFPVAVAYVLSKYKFKLNAGNDRVKRNVL
ncbi:hypothetical protein FACS1894211_17010 [Clostridia bacterium]|nr:hypothetical protein FACS1894211_17010 [Clostridia bacterium]